ncbi:MULTISPECIES: cbb3-type cytochrome oxidase assembly protein CcoS [Psychroflexus]|uniref:Cytochrome oxidase maturation protein, cbb3-type n=1 Tax=Psychroflexus halocasei TaxID=908615 RepID=A0A1H3YI74_9FLAO|nr:MULTISPECIES: cbb3-type cytochrome oxidase assembly protein CcoS [Psychroflexus]PJX24542.1 cbb3-type cytochrome oxidase assembly protein CcoS [Psychroflexus sp. S27]SEA10901.1 cytochrome oxidase maturation protein, cbb3-type [Psychroflexus halocasei]
MSAIYGLLAISITIAIVFFVIFVLSVKKGQYDDAYTPSVRMLFDDELVDEEKKSEEKVEKKQKSSQSNHKHKQV